MMEFTRTSEGEWHLNKQRIADAWFIWIIIRYYSQIQKLEEISFKISFLSKRLDIEHICKLMWQEICSRQKNRYNTAGRPPVALKAISLLMAMSI